MLMHEILQTHLLRALVANLKIDAIYALYLESFCDNNLAVRKVFAFCDSEVPAHSYLDTNEDKMSRRDNFALLPFFNEEVLPIAEEWMGGEDDQRRNALGNGGNQDGSTDGDIAPRRPIVA